MTKPVPGVLLTVRLAVSRVNIWSWVVLHNGVPKSLLGHMSGCEICCCMVRFEEQPEAWLGASLSLSCLPHGPEEKLDSLSVRGTDFEPLVR